MTCWSWSLTIGACCRRSMSQRNCICYHLLAHEKVGFYRCRVCFITQLAFTRKLALALTDYPHGSPFIPNLRSVTDISHPPAMRSVYIGSIVLYCLRLGGNMTTD
ncbi:hypothetical protein GGS23DRAFT_586919, partial [Durotheca rogersii]|uniref:uncharacterized protein n=1 Tax=Durotheca rogersii TaxID=419775 RepID=UPI00221F3EAF